MQGRLLKPQRIAALVVIGLAPVLCATASGATLFSNLAMGVTTGVSPGDPLPPRRAAFLARSPEEVTPFAHLLRPGEADVVRRVNWQKYVVLAAIVQVPDPCTPADVAHVSRKRTTLVVSVVVTGHVDGCVAVIGWRYHVVKLRRATLRPLPRRVALKIVRRA